MTTEAAVGELVQVAFERFGGVGDAGARILRRGSEGARERMKIYISGQITGLEYNEAARMFENARQFLIAGGHEPCNPMQGETPGLTWADYIAKDIILLDMCDGIYMLPTWRESKGARIEHAFAEITGKLIYYAHSRVPVVLTEEEVDAAV